jgi:cytochrome c-type biogenesis protein CcmH/NrfG
MLLDKKRASVMVKIGAGLLAVTFAAYFVAVLIPSFQGGSGSGTSSPAPAGQSKGAYTQEASRLQSDLSKNPQNKDLWIQLGNLYFDNKNYGEAVTAYSKAVELDPDNLNVRTDLGTSYSFLNKMDEAKQQFEIVVKADPNHLISLYNLGVVAAGQKRVSDARTYWNKVIKLAPQSEVGKAAKDGLKRL